MNQSELVRIELDDVWRFSSRFSGRSSEEALIGCFSPFQGVPLQWAHYHPAAPRLCQRTTAPSVAPRRIRLSSASPLAEASGKLLVLSYSHGLPPPAIPVGCERRFILSASLTLCSETRSCRLLVQRSWVLIFVAHRRLQQERLVSSGCAFGVPFCALRIDCRPFRSLQAVLTPLLAGASRLSSARVLGIHVCPL